MVIVTCAHTHVHICVKINQNVHLRWVRFCFMCIISRYNTLRNTFVLICFLLEEEKPEKILDVPSVSSHTDVLIKAFMHNVETTDLSTSSSSWIKINGPRKILDPNYSLLLLSSLVLKGFSRLILDSESTILNSLVEPRSWVSEAALSSWMGMAAILFSK